MGPTICRSVMSWLVIALPPQQPNDQSMKERMDVLSPTLEDWLQEILVEVFRNAVAGI